MFERMVTKLTAVLAAIPAAVILAMTATACSSSSAGTNSGVVNAIGAESQYANVLSQIGGKYVHVTSILDNPNTDPHAFEASAQVAAEVSTAALIVQNGVSYDTWIDRIESASANPARKVIVVQQVLHLPASTPNPHLWYDPRTMPAVAAIMASDLSALRPAHSAYFRARMRAFDRSLAPWLNAIAAFKAAHPGTTAATSEPVADYLLTAMGIKNLTPFTFQADIMNGVDPSPQDIALENGFFSKHQVRLFAYNQQVTSSLTATIGQNALRNGVPVVAVYETMPTPGYDYQSWMLAETLAITKAVTSKISTQKL